MLDFKCEWISKKIFALFQHSFTTCKMKKIIYILTKVFYIFKILRYYSEKLSLTLWYSKFQLTFNFFWQTWINFFVNSSILFNMKPLCRAIFYFSFASHKVMLLSAIFKLTISLLPTFVCFISYTHLYYDNL